MDDNELIKDYREFLQSMFYSDKDNSRVLPIVKSPNEMLKISKFINDDSVSKENKINFINALTDLFQENLLLIPYINNFVSLYSLGLDLFLKDNNQSESDSIIKFLQITRNNLTMTKEILSKVYQKLTKFFDNKYEQKLNHNLLLKYIKLLQIFYEEEKQKKKAEEKQLQKEDEEKLIRASTVKPNTPLRGSMPLKGEHQIAPLLTSKLSKVLKANMSEEQMRSIKNYFYFTGVGSSMKVELNHSKTKNDLNFPTIDFGLTFVFWLKLDEKVIDSYFQTSDNKKIVLFDIHFENAKRIIVSMIAKNRLTVSIFGKVPDVEIRIENHFKFNKWNLFFGLIKKKEIKKDTYLYLYVNNEYVYREKNEEFARQQITGITFFKNLVGRVSSVLVFTFDIEDSRKYFTSYPYGIYKTKYLYEIIKQNHPNYLSNAINNKFEECNPRGQTKLKFSFDSSKQKNGYNLMVFTPFLYNQHKKIIDDACGNFCAKLSKESGVNIYYHNGLDLKMLGGINNVLPIAEILLSSFNKKNLVNIPHDLLTEESFNEYLNLIKILIVDSNDNLIDANHRSFFSSLSLFLEKFPKEVYSKRILETFTDIGKYVLSVETTVKQKRAFNNTILLNEKIISKFSNELQERLWEKINLFATMDLSQIKNVLTIPKICLLLRFLDESRYEEFCCKDHANMFMGVSEISIMNPEMKSKIKKFGDIITKIIIANPKDSIWELFKLLSLDISPCLQKLIIQIFLDYFNSPVIEGKIKEEALTKLIKNKGLDIVLYSLSLALPDNRCMLIDLLGIFLNNFPNIVYKEMLALNQAINSSQETDNPRFTFNIKNSLCFISDNILPTNMYLEDEGGKLMPIISKFKSEEYLKQVKMMWYSLKKMFYERKEVRAPEVKKKKSEQTSQKSSINKYVIDFIVKFASQSFPHCIEQVIMNMSGFIDTPEFANLQENENFFKWIVQSIFIFEDEEKLLKETQINPNQIENIKRNLIGLFERIVKVRFVERMRYVLKYSIFLYKENPGKKKMFQDTTRYLLIQVFKEMRKIIDKTKLSFEFMILWSNYIFFTTETEDKSVLTILSEKGFIPKFYIEHLSYNEDIKDPENQTLSNLWKDYPLFEIIYDSCSYLWDIEKLCKEAGIDLTEDPSVEKIAPKLIQEFCFTKKDKKNLIEEIRKLLLKKTSCEDLSNISISMLNILAILQTIAIDISRNEAEVYFWTQNFEKFITFCILGSVSIPQGDQDFESFQSDFKEILGFCLAFMKGRSSERYNSLMSNYIIPIIKKGNEGTENQTKIKQFGHLITRTKINFKKYAINEVIKYYYYNSQGTLVTNCEESEASEGSSSFEIKMDCYSTIGPMFNFEPYILMFNNSYKKEIDLMYSFYEPKVISPETIIEKKRIEDSIKEVVPFFENQIKQYSNDSFLEGKMRKSIYKGYKKRLFSWKGLWSDRYLFYSHPEYLKLKLKNHYTREMTRPLLTPILDINYYLPNFTKFNTEKLFKEDSYKYEINLDIDNILRSENETEGEKQEETKKKNYILETIYKLGYPSLTDDYVKYSKQKIDFEKFLPTIAETNKLLFKDTRPHLIYYCCMVKSTHHIKGIITLEKKKIKFFAALNEENQSINYDTDRGTCFGSYFNNNKKDKDKFSFKLNYSDIKYVFKRNFFYQSNSVEIFTEGNKSYYFTFDEKNDIYEQLGKKVETKRNLKIQGEKHIGFERMKGKKNKDYSISNIEDDWSDHKISTLGYLMWLNIYANRSFNDLTQYPVLPWIFTDYTSEKLSSSINTLRKFNLPMGMMDINEKAETRKEAYIETFETMKCEYLSIQEDKKEKMEMEINPIEINQVPYFYGSHYSNPTYVSHFLMRLFPFSSIMIEIQGIRFDDPDRLFVSMEKSFESSTTQKVDIRELTPEFFYLPELFLNVNQLNLIQIEQNEEGQFPDVSSVVLPKWSQNNPYLFTTAMRRAIEREDITTSDASEENGHFLPDWINLIFGAWQRGKPAEEHCNIFMANTYNDTVKIDNIKNKEDRDALMRLVEMGMTPNQVLTNQAKQRKSGKDYLRNKSKSFGVQICDAKQLVSIKDALRRKRDKLAQEKESAETTKEGLPSIKYMHFLDCERLFIMNERRQYFIMKISIIEKEIKNIGESRVGEIVTGCSNYIVNYEMSDMHFSNRNLLYNKCSKMFIGGFFDGHIERISFDTDGIKPCGSQILFPKEDSPIMVMCLNEEDSTLITGARCGLVCVYKIDSDDFRLTANLFHHDTEITSIAYSRDLNMFATASIDGYIFLYTLPIHDLVRSIRINDPSNIIQKIYLVSKPLPSLLVISSMGISSYSINGGRIAVEPVGEEITHTELFVSANFEEFLIYSVGESIVIRELPNLGLRACKDVNEKVNLFTLSEDKKYCYYWSKGDSFGVLKDISVEGEPISNNLSHVGFNV